MHEPTRVLFVCVGNTFRSQMAEGLARALGGEKLEVKSAGT
ncbi:MAG: arsenate reductase/protein-tyrosine-phosphatase family protein, partial [Planctomycetota bacterium]